MISNSLGSSKKLSELPVAAGPLCDFCQALYPLIVVNSDDFGRMDADAFTVKHRVFPVSPHSEADFEEALHALDRVGLIVLYEAQGKRYLQVTNFDPHQIGLHKRTKSRIPEAPQVASPKVSEVPGNSGSRGEKGKEENNTKPTQVESNSSNLHLREGEGVPAHPQAKPGKPIPAGMVNHPAVIAYYLKFETVPTVYNQELIASRVGERLQEWEETLHYWLSNGHRAQSVGKMLDRFNGNKFENGGGNAGRGGVTRIVGEAAPKPGKYSGIGGPDGDNRRCKT